MIHKTTVKTLNELHAILPQGCNQVAAVFNNGAWEVAYIVATTAVEPVPA